MKKLLSIPLCACLLLTVTACGGGTTDPALTGTEISKGGNSQPDTTKQPENEPEQSADEGETASGSNILVAYFSLAGEQYEVGVIEKGTPRSWRR